MIFFAQPYLGYTSKYFDVAFSAKFSLVNLGYMSSGILKDSEPADYNYEESLKVGNLHFLCEPGLVIRGRISQCKTIVSANILCIRRR